jgi:cyclase
VAVGLACVSREARPQGQAMDTVHIRVQKLADRVYALFGQGGNIGLSVGDDGAFVIDDQFAPLSSRIRAAIATVTDRPIRFVVNTHWHGDHTGGNEILGEAGAVIVAHDNVRKRMSTRQLIERGGVSTSAPSSPYKALPIITFSEDVTFHLNGDSLHVVHVPPAHTDGDAIIFFTKQNVIHMGDTFFNGRYPFIDASSGGNVDGLVGAADMVLAVANDQTRIIPGHGEVGTRADLAEYRRVVSTIRDRIRTLVAQAKSLDEVKRAKPTAEFDAKWGTGGITAEMLIETIYNGFKARPDR